MLFTWVFLLLHITQFHMCVCVCVHACPPKNSVLEPVHKKVVEDLEQFFKEFLVIIIECMLLKYSGTISRIINEHFKNFKVSLKLLEQV